MGFGIQQSFAVESGILGFGIRDTAQEIRNPTNDWNPESKFHSLEIRNPVRGIRNPDNLSCGIRNSGLWNPEYSSRNPESHERLESGIQVPMTKNPESTPWNRHQETVLDSPRIGLLYLEQKSRRILFY